MLDAALAELEGGGLVGDTPSTTRARHDRRSALTTSRLVVRASLAREQDRGLFMTGRRP